MMRILTLTLKFLILIAFIKCKEENVINPALLIGNWQVDSIYTYQNGFDFMRRGGTNWGSYQYHNSGKISEHKMENKREFLFEVIAPDSLVYKSPDQKPLATFKIMKLNDKVLVLKKNLQPLIKGPNQQSYEVRFFSKN
ncbi:hypothetical protein [Flexithrix dorotheae]|uniref:hypothetical protein n=1 Tax=Flexithrix dorotheae TaxID=70993 RepID=UPI0012F7FE7D|nr:hypothetical protein [Flexithrix dorotheae]